LYFEQKLTAPMSTLPNTGKPRLAAKARLKWDEVRQQPLLLFPEGVLMLNPTAHEVVALCDGQRTIGQIVADLRKKFDNEAVDADVRELLARLAGKGLLVIAD
jgi:pyrroloquinoline quinone biosynthesis protein D